MFASLTGYMLTSSGYPVKLGYILQILLKWSVIFLQSWTSTGYSSNSTDSFVTNCRFSPIIAPGLSSEVWQGNFETPFVSLQRYRGAHKFLGTSKHQFTRPNLHVFYWSSSELCACNMESDNNFFLTFVLLQVSERICKVLADYKISS